MLKPNHINLLGGGVNENPLCATVLAPIQKLRKNLAFTLAEVLITLGIIGIVAAMVLPSLISSIKKHTVESRLKHSYALLNEVVRLAQADYGDPSAWDYNDGLTFVQNYMLPYMRTSKLISNNKGGFVGDKSAITLSNGTVWTITKMAVPASQGQPAYNFIRVNVDVNGDSNPNRQGIDLFNFYILSAERKSYNTGEGDCAKSVKSAGIYYDGYGYKCPGESACSYRQCDGRDDTTSRNSFCIAKIIENNWKIPKDYPLKF